ncbi:MAG: outer membrane protein assembly factor BamD [Burkholderiaceae bacterium]|nr:outer membrane protein assembly factor BamD [Burkholderiaceae bacterium]
MSMTVLHVWRSTAAGLLVLCLALAGCSSNKTPPPVPPGQQAGGSALPPGVEQLYADAKSDMASGAWDAAIKTLERVEGRAAGTLLAQQAQLDLAYAYWRSGERAQALAAIERYIKLNPSSPALDYALYLRGVINFNDDIGVMGSLAGQDLAERDSRASRDSYQAFKQLVTQFPQSPYSEDARLRMDYILNTLAEYELHVARYYFRRGAFVAAVNRAQQAVVDFEGAPATEEALYIMVQGYDRLGLETLRDDANRVFVTNFPNSKLPSEGLRRTGKAWWHIWN